MKYNFLHASSPVLLLYEVSQCTDMDDVTSHYMLQFWSENCKDGRTKRKEIRIRQTKEREGGGELTYFLTGRTSRNWELRMTKLMTTYGARL
jgi:hypothetical protein